MASTERRYRKAVSLVATAETQLVAQGFKRTALNDIAKLSQKLWSKGVVGLGVANRIVAGEQLKSLAFKVYVERKLPTSKLGARKSEIPKTFRIPGLETPIETDVEEVGRQKPEGSFTSLVRPAFPGCCLGSVRISGGTFGCLVRRPGIPGLFILSNSHVLAFCGQGKKGDRIVQPDLSHGGKSSNHIATLEDWVPFDLSEGAVNYCDAAIAAVEDPDTVVTRIGIIGTPRGVATKITRNMAIQKTGAATGHTTGTVKDIDYVTNLRYDDQNGLAASVRYARQVLCTKYSEGGDSGAAVCDMAGNVVGLHFAGSPSTSVFSPIALVMKALKIEPFIDDRA
jgi:hypothetical protein